MRAIETTAVVDKKHHLLLDHDLPIESLTKVKIIVLYPEAEDDISEEVWMAMAQRGGAFSDWDAPEEDVYTFNDGKPFNDDSI